MLLRVGIADREKPTASKIQEFRNRVFCPRSARRAGTEDRLHRRLEKCPATVRDNFRELRKEVGQGTA
jgi:hypothetical protein